jgi:heme-degrading monooxygenase HmoA
MIVTVFRARLRPENSEAYFKLAGELGAEAETMPGFVSRKVYVAEDGERVTIVEFESEETHRGWAEHHRHRAAQKLGREQFYSEYSLQVRQTLRTSTLNRGDRNQASLCRECALADMSHHMGQVVRLLEEPAALGHVRRAWVCLA